MASPLKRHNLPRGQSIPGLPGSETEAYFFGAVGEDVFGLESFSIAFIPDHNRLTFDLASSSS